MQRLGGRNRGQTVLRFLAVKNPNTREHIRGEDEEKLLMSEVTMVPCSPTFT